MPSPAPIQRGYLDSQGHPIVRITIHGVAEEAAQEFEAMIDTGFTGFLLMPLTSALPLTLTLMGSSNYSLADGSISPKLLAFGTVILDGEPTQGPIVLEQNECELLLGMDFLKKTNRALVVHEGGALLVLNDALADFAPALHQPQ